MKIMTCNLFTESDSKNIQEFRIFERIGKGIPFNIVPKRIQLRSVHRVLIMVSKLRRP